MTIEQRMNQSIRENGFVGDVLIGIFGHHPDTMENAILVRLSEDVNMVARDFCVLEKPVCNSDSETSQENENPAELECPEISKNKQCGKFKWNEIEFEENHLEKRFCLAISSVMPDNDPENDRPIMTREDTMHDRNSCGDYGATRLWFRSSNGEKLFDEIIDELQDGKHDFLILSTFCSTFSLESFYKFICNEDAIFVF